MPQTASSIRALHGAQWLVLVLMLGVFGLLLGYFVHDERRRTLEREYERLIVQARVIDDNLAQQLAGIESALESMRPETLLSSQDTAGNRERSAHMGMLVSAMPAVRTMLMIDPQGLVLAGSRPGTIGFDARQRPYFQRATAKPSPDLLYASEPFVTTLNIYALNLVKPWLAADGTLLGLSTATLDPDYFKVLLESVRYAGDMRVTLIHGEGKVFLTMPTHTAMIGRQVDQPGMPVGEHLVSGKRDTQLITERTVTGDRRLMVLHSVDPPGLRLDKPFVLALSRHHDSVLAPWRQLALVAGLCYAAVCAAALIGMSILRRKQKALEALAQARAADAREQADRLEAALLGGNLGLIDLDIPSGARRVNAQAKQIVGDGPEDPVDTHEQWLARIHPEDREGTHAVFRAHDRGETASTTMEYRVRHKMGHWIWLLSRGRITERAPDGTPLRLIGTYQDISERKSSEAQIAEFAFQDPLTKLANRRLLMDRLRLAQAATARSGRLAALLFMDLDHFKPVNDTLGHDIGDLLLQQVAQRLLASVRRSDTVARLGGDEFVLVLDPIGDTPEDAREHALNAAQKILATLGEPVQLGDQLRPIGASIGITIFSGEAAGASELLKQADQALYRAKLAGRNRAAVYDKDLPA